MLCKVVSVVEGEAVKCTRWFRGRWRVVLGCTGETYLSNRWEEQYGSQNSTHRRINCVSI